MTQAPRDGTPNVRGLIWVGYGPLVGAEHVLGTYRGHPFNSNRKCLRYLPRL